MLKKLKINLPKLIMLMKFFQILKKDENMINMGKKDYLNKEVEVAGDLKICLDHSLGIKEIKYKEGLSLN